MKALKLFSLSPPISSVQQGVQCRSAQGWKAELPICCNFTSEDWTLTQAEGGDFKFLVKSSGVIFFTRQEDIVAGEPSSHDQRIGSRFDKSEPQGARTKGRKREVCNLDAGI